jgi:hypothetical protein
VFAGENSYQDLLQQPSYEMVVLMYYSPMEIHRALQEPQNATVDILAVVTVMDDSDRTPYYPNEIWEVALMDVRYVSKLVFDVHYAPCIFSVSIFWYFVQQHVLSSYIVA